MMLPPKVDPTWVEEQRELQRRAKEIFGAGAIGGMLMSRFEVQPVCDDQGPTNVLTVTFDDLEGSVYRVTVELEP